MVSREVQQFSNAMGEWWDPTGPARALHQLNPVRVRFVRQFASECWPQPAGSYPLEGVSVLDVGCGGGLLSEALARLGGDVTGIDASERAVQVATARVGKMPVKGQLKYRVGSPEDLKEKSFDLVVCSEVIEHVADPDAFVGQLTRLSRRGAVVSTLNRTAKSYMAAVVLGEYALGLVPPGTHDWDKFVTPEELQASFRSRGMTRTAISGLFYNPLVRPYWSLTALSTDVNYIAAFRK